VDLAKFEPLVDDFHEFFIHLELVEGFNLLQEQSKVELHVFALFQTFIVKPDHKIVVD